jgi:hypothetical protein
MWVKWDASCEHVQVHKVKNVGTNLRVWKVWIVQSGFRVYKIPVLVSYLTYFCPASIITGCTIFSISV